MTASQNWQEGRPGALPGHQGRRRWQEGEGEY